MGFSFLVTPSGGKLWRLKYRFGGKEHLLALGAYPEISLADARGRRDTARQQVAHKIDPGAIKKAQKEAPTEETKTFETIAREWYDKFLPTWTAGHAYNRKPDGKGPVSLDRQKPIAEIKAPELLETLAG